MGPKVMFFHAGMTLGPLYYFMSCFSLSNTFA